MAGYMITRDEAIDTLYDLTNSEVLNKDIETKLCEIISCLMAEQVGRHEWGADPREISELYVARRQDFWSDELVAKCEAIDKKYRFIPSDFEKEEMIEDYVNSSDDDELSDAELRKEATEVLMLDKKIK